MSDLWHRIFLVPLRPEVDVRWAHEHWTGHHSVVFGGNPGLRGYVQNRPPRQDWAARTHICAEAWFDDKDAERAAFRSRYYLDEVVPDEDRFVQRAEAWHAGARIDRSASRRRRYRVLVFGHTPTSATLALAGWAEDEVDVYLTDRALPLGGRRSILGLWTDDPEQAAAAAARFGPLAFLTEPAAIVTPPQPPWNGANS